MKERIAASLVILLSIVLFPYWAYLPLILAAMILFPFYWEAIIFGFLIDVLYGPGIGGWSELFSPMAFSAVIILFVLMPLRERLRFDS